ncbi:anti-sigma factor [Hyphomicrobium sp.]|uniref:anti-sigma factor n=1 Tax=Hyphomicrobium sp. TaxID=82 RepID=UPI0025B88DED|nr:anti-sigma factor [Hyphomicrobium sp.]MCC7252263.1 anti-sigma factor [Hyphomicrobium sp.]
MTELDDIDALAAEYVLGTLSFAERSEAEARRARDPAFDKAVLAWERRLGPLVEAVVPVAPPAGLYNKIRAQIGLASHVASLKAREQAIVRRANRWRNAAIGMTAVAASLAGIIGWQDYQRRLMPTQYVAVLQAGDAVPAFLLTVDTKSNMFVISAMQKPAEPEKSYQLWLVHNDMPQPKSLGVFDDAGMDVRPMRPDGPMHDMMMDGTYAVSVEPKGGSPTGTPTGPVVFSGKLVKATP